MTRSTATADRRGGLAQGLATRAGRHLHWLVAGQLLLACGKTAEPTSALGQAAESEAPAQPTPPRATIPLAQVRAKVEDEVEAMRRLLLLGGVTGKALGEANNKLQSRAFARRIPANLALEALRSTLRQSAEAAGLTVLDVRCDPPPQPPPAPPAAPLGTTERWTVDEDQMLGTIDVTVDLEGTTDAIANWINALPGTTERFWLVRGAQRLGERAVRLTGQAFFERPMDQRRVDVSWPPLDEWLRAAGHDPKAASVTGDPDYSQLAKAVQLGRELIPDVRSVLVSTNDLPRWAARTRIFARCSSQIAAVDGQAVLSQLPDPPAAPAAQ